MLNTMLRELKRAARTAMDVHVADQERLRVTWAWLYRVAKQTTPTVTLRWFSLLVCFWMFGALAGARD